ncbi:MAG TPA: rhodanese-like domain-containing protein [Anaerolineales bacterium]|nr:rhodanese-like domain-containing protein [Anaerolineales bacterium]
MKRIKYILLATLILFLTSLACNALLPQTEPTSAPTTIETQILVPTPTTEPVATQPEANLPQTDAEVPRVPADQAKAALDGGDAVIVDVRGADAYARSHITGALEVSLSAIQTDPANLPLDKNIWIITYCT